MPYVAFIAAVPADPAALLPPLPATNTLRGNPNLALAAAQPARGLDPRGARTCAGCPYRSPAIHGRHRCPAGQARGQAPHGGRSPGPRTPECLSQRRPAGRIRVRDARTIHGNARTIPGNDSANASADNDNRLTLFRGSRVDVSLDRYQTYLSPAPSADRPLQGAPTPGPTVPFKPFRTDPLNREPGAVPNPEPRTVHRVHDPAHIRNPRDAPHSRRQRRRQEIFAADERR